ncbi:hypothetical protein [Peribacillus deserti]|uniref:Uncharacterized protein n=1 Tax=Peribacillus deserti TaxID=673318 RepID=A0A2N5M3D2_9BACI|nr:hypothetical protein [Peribacillus deserti]PLT28876.1 hypothetical protein CUU66_16140 [Peribacillus deserti]
MRFSELVTWKNYQLSFEQISEPRKSQSALRIFVNGSEDATDLLIYPASDVSTFQIDFPSYVSYMVTYDDYTLFDVSEVFTGDSFRIFSRSAFIDKQMKQLQPVKKYTHYSLSCIEHVVDVISFDEPSIRLLNSKDEQF